MRIRIQNIASFPSTLLPCVDLNGIRFFWSDLCQEFFWDMKVDFRFTEIDLWEYHNPGIRNEEKHSPSEKKCFQVFRNLMFLLSFELIFIIFGSYSLMRISGSTKNNLFSDPDLNPGSNWSYTFLWAYFLSLNAQFILYYNCSKRKKNRFLIFACWFRHERPGCSRWRMLCRVMTPIRTSPGKGRSFSLPHIYLWCCYIMVVFATAAWQNELLTYFYLRIDSQWAK